MFSDVRSIGILLISFLITESKFILCLPLHPLRFEHPATAKYKDNAAGLFSGLLKMCPSILQRDKEIALLVVTAVWWHKFHTTSCLNNGRVLDVQDLAQVVAMTHI